MSNPCMEMVVVTHVRQIQGSVDEPPHEERTEVFRSEDWESRDNSSSREDVLRRPEVFEKTKDIPGSELEVSIARVPFLI